MEPLQFKNYLEIHQSFRSSPKENLFKSLRPAPLTEGTAKKQHHWTLSLNKKRFPNFFLGSQISHLKRKLDGLPASESKLLTPKECRQALKIVERWLEKNEDASPEINDFMHHLVSCNYISDLQNLRENKTQLLPALKEYINRLEKIGDKTRHYQKQFSIQIDPFMPEGLIDEYFAPELLLPKRSPPLSFTEEEFNIIISCNLKEYKQGSISNEEFLCQISKLIDNPGLAKKYVQVSQLHAHVPFLINGKVVRWTDISYNGMIPDQEKLQKNLESIEKASLFFKKQGGLSAFNNKLQEGKLDIKTLRKLAKLAKPIQLPFEKLNQDNLDSQTKHLVELVKKAKELAPLIELNDQVKNISGIKNFKAIDQMEAKIKKAGVESLTKSEFQLLLQLLYIKQNLPGSLLVIPNINKYVPLLQYFEEMGPSLHQASEAIFQKRNNPPENCPTELKNFFKILDKIEVAYQAKEKGTPLTKEQKIKFKEFFLYKKYISIFDYRADCRKVDNHFSALVSRNQQEPFINVCIFSSRAQVEQDPNSNLEEKIIKLVRLVISKTFFKYSHSNFLEYDGENYQKHGLWSRGIYHKKFSPNWSPKTKECTILAEALFPKNLTLEEQKNFKEVFYSQLKDRINMINNEVKFPSNSYRRFFGVGIPPEKKKPSDIQVREREEIFCSQFICETIIEAHVATCQSLGYDPPDSLSFYGLKKNENLSALTPSKLYKKFLKSGIFQEVDNPLFR